MVDREGRSESLPRPTTDEQLANAAVGGTPTPLNGPVILSDYDPAWPILFEKEGARVKAALGDSALLIEHVGSTSVVGLAAKPTIDILLVVEKTPSEKSYVPALESVGYVLRRREPEWHEHRLFNRPEANVNLHVFSRGDDEIDRMLVFRDWLRSHQEDKDLYLKTKRELAGRTWRYTQDYADAKSEVITSILKRAQSPETGSRS